MLADALGPPLRVLVTRSDSLSGQTGGITQTPALLHGRSGAAVFADKAHDATA